MNYFRLYRDQTVSRWRLLWVWPLGTLFWLALAAGLSAVLPAKFQQDLSASQINALSPTDIAASLTGLHLALMLFIPAVWLMMRLLKLKMGQIWSIEGRFRWRLYWKTMGWSWLFMLPLWLLSLTGLISTAWQWRPEAGLGWFLLIIFLLTPWQALAEELVFRGLLNQSITHCWNAKWSPLFAVLISSVLFGFIHGVQQDPLLLLDRIGLGLLFSWLCWRSGGLEIACAVHSVNNQFAFLLVVLSGQLNLILYDEAVHPLEVLAHVLCLLSLGWWLGTRYAVKNLKKSLDDAI